MDKVEKNNKVFVSWLSASEASKKVSRWPDWKKVYSIGSSNPVLPVQKHKA